MGQTALLPFQRQAEDFFRPKKIRRLRPGANPRSWEPEASMPTTRPPNPHVAGWTWTVFITRLVVRFVITTVSVRNIWDNPSYVGIDAPFRMQMEICRRRRTHFTVTVAGICGRFSSRSINIHRNVQTAADGRLKACLSDISVCADLMGFSVGTQKRYFYYVMP
jgi:hypothetical protein